MFNLHDWVFLEDPAGHILRYVAPDIYRITLMKQCNIVCSYPNEQLKVRFLK